MVAARAPRRPRGVAKAACQYCSMIRPRRNGQAHGAGCAAEQGERHGKSEALLCRYCRYFCFERHRAGTDRRMLCSRLTGIEPSSGAILGFRLLGLTLIEFGLIKWFVREVARLDCPARPADRRHGRLHSRPDRFESGPRLTHVDESGRLGAGGDLRRAAARLSVFAMGRARRNSAPRSRNGRTLLLRPVPRRGRLRFGRPRRPCPSRSRARACRA